MLNRRHVLAYPTAQARKELVPAVVAGLPEPMRGPAIAHRVRQAFLADGIPGIVCRPTQACPDNGGQIGFSFPFRIGEERVRSAVPVRADQIEHYVTPYEVMDRAGASPRVVHPVLIELRKVAAAAGVRLGLIGSAAMQVVTGLDYLRPDSDLDVLVEAGGPQQLQRFWQEACALSTRTGTAIDAEIDMQGRCGVKLSEYMSDAELLLAKTISGVELIGRNQFSDETFSKVSLTETASSLATKGVTQWM
ncbi:phosphoribosyl-dephospho-CoA transferase [Rhodobium orientis]|uniref:Malonate decarboxylase holo-[acyl-carrier-protein] synthase n=1 Tax=Rhodobium orientis TaxID=34017 RepID=A0A327JZK3_9HYPH|nr:malonate decarboxylase holo-[acyl-carrier-protein] synthase [Rhodobium orientis]MBB4303748.1 phosphoribosyl-dephospho-CoA transferase [Rhodobium orientis]MBK5951798.1 malonate decarboxylase holo-[acyl-carrier-protein] synthase [Rhodobium orientis]RAI28528.1 malonate decarboxylase holo-[acyl-carrier-protein] synthase [Rhodobium orientis]